MRVLITGATGLIGNEIVKRCHESGIAVNYLTTNKLKLSNKDNYKGFYWNPNENEIDANSIKEVNAIIHLVGASISKRWTATHKKAILDSRIKTTALLYETLKSNSHNIAQIISASAIGRYPSSLTKYYTEDESEVSTSFLGTVVKEWETAVDAFSELDITVSKIRIGLVFSSKGGAFPQMVKPIKYGLGAMMGSGAQWMSWIHIDDLSSLFLHILNHHLKGVYNGVSPNPETNAILTKSIAKQIRRPLIFPNIPKMIMALVLGEMHMLLFESQRVSSKKVEDSGFRFKYYALQNALDQLL